MKICALIAAYNEMDKVDSVVKGVLPHVDGVVVVDDGSRDGTAVLAARAGARVLRHPENLGKGAAVRTGLVQVLGGDCSHILFMDADMQHDPDDIPLLVEKALSGRGDFIVAERQFRKEDMPRARFWANTIGSRIMSLLIGTSIDDSQTGFRLIRSSLLSSLHLTARRYEVETEILVKLVRRGTLVEMVKVSANYKDGRSKMRPFRDVFRICMLAMSYRYFTGVSDVR